MAAVLDKAQILGQGRTLFKQGEKGGELYFISEGKVELSIKDPETGHEMIIATVGDKSVIGSMSFLEGDPRSATATAKTEVKYIAVTEGQRDKMLATVPVWLQVLLKDLSKSLRRSNEVYGKLKHEHDLLEKRYKLKEKQKAEVEEKLTKTEQEYLSFRQTETSEKEELKKQIKEIQKKCLTLEEALAKKK